MDMAVSKYPKEKQTAILQLQVSESCKNILRVYQGNPALATSIRNELAGDSLQLESEPLQQAMKMIDGLYGRYRVYRVVTRFKYETMITRKAIMTQS